MLGLCIAASPHAQNPASATAQPDCTTALFYALELRLCALRLLDLSDNNLTGGLPRNASALTALTSLSLRNNRLSSLSLSGLPVSTTLRRLDLQSNGIFGSVPPSVSLLQGLEYVAWLPARCACALPRWS